MGTFGIPEDEPIYNSMITRSLEKAQTRIEELNFDARKHVLSYDDVLNIQRKSVYARRRSLLMGGDQALFDELSKVAESKEGAGDIFAAKRAELGTAFSQLARRFLLQTIDYLWVDHLEAMEYLRSSVNLRAYGQRDPLVEYKKEGLTLFQTMESVYREQILDALPRLGDPQPQYSTPTITITPTRAQAVENAARTITSQSDAGVSQKKEYGRNDRVTITNGTETREGKYKKFEDLLTAGEWRIVE
jgi:preprotein translocase subunit SecA